MDLTMSADQRDLRSGLRGYLDDHWTPGRLRSVADAPALDREDWSALAELGVFGLELPEDRGGAGLGPADAAIVFEELGRALVPGPLVASFLAAGTVGGASDGAAVVTALDTADPVPVVEHLEAAAHVVLIGDDGLHLVPSGALRAVPAAAPLDPLTPVWQVTGPLPPGERIGTAANAARWRSRGAVLTAALQVGVAQGALDLAVRYAGEREQFGRAVGSFQAVKHLLADSLVRVDLARAAVWTAALTLDDPHAHDPHADDHGGEHGGDPGEAVASAKILAEDAASANGRCCVQVHGGMGFTWEVIAHLYLKRAWLLETCYGGAGEHARRLAEAL
ncbi:acyl-CoA dehydrogenase family protein [Actinomadura viridis]|uniref:acyl-CoA dehydrogenase family protein n=1 Tax=Actinomadura viridis TaxID=58110 RepID=UPI00367DFD87